MKEKKFDDLLNEVELESFTCIINMMKYNMNFGEITIQYDLSLN
jgi:hypothetical protein